MSSDKRDQDAGRKFKCNICGKTFTLKTNRNRHLRVHLLNSDPECKYQCDICGKKFTRIDNMTQHMRRKHESSQVVCNICGMKLSCPSARIRHMWLQHRNLDLRRPLQHDIFEEEFTQKSHVSRHVRGKHESSLVEFDISGNNFMYQGYLRSHSRPNHMFSLPFRCSICETRYSTSHALEVHSLTHISNPNENNQFECKTCKKSFTRASELKMHGMICMPA